MNRAAFGGPNPRGIALVLLSGLALVAVCGCAARVGRSPSSSGPAGVGHKWRLTEVTAGGQTSSIPESITATIQFTADGKFLADDSVNAMFGTWVSTPAGYRVGSSGTTLVAYAGPDSTRLEVMGAIGSVTVAAADVAAHSTGTTLTLTVPKYTLTFVEAGPAATFPPPSPTTGMTQNSGADASSALPS